MIYGVGVDIVDIKRFTKVLNKMEERFISKIFTGKEIDECKTKRRWISSLAMKFSAKEAFSKAIRTGMRMGVRWKDIEIYHIKGGAPQIRLYGKAQDICNEKGIKRVHLSLSDHGDYAISMVVLEV